MLIFINFLFFVTCAVQTAVADHEVQETTPLSADPLENAKETQRYIDDSTKNDGDFDSYVFAYNRGKFLINNSLKSKLHKRVKRTPPQLIKFELADAKEPDEMTKEFFKRIREQRALEALKSESKVANKEDAEDALATGATRKNDDQELGEGQIVQVYAANRRQMKVANMPMAVKQAIDNIARRKSGLYKTQPAKRYAASADGGNAFYGDKTLNFAPHMYGELPYKLDNSLYKGVVNLDFASQIPYIPALFPDSNHYSSSSQIQGTADQQGASLQQMAQDEAEKNVPQLKFVHFAKPLFAPQMHKIEDVPNLQSHNNVNINLPSGGKSIQIKFENANDEFHNHEAGSVGQAENQNAEFHFTDDTEAMTKVLAGLISKTPTEQLQGLSRLLNKKPDGSKNAQNDPASNRAPILFPPVGSLNPEAATMPRRPGNKFISLGHVTEAAPKEFTPITEQVLEDVTPAPFVQYVPIKPLVGETSHFESVAPHSAPLQPTSYKHVSIGSLPHYEEQTKFYDEDDKKLQYASKYNFGYRIRDFHSGNDFGHSEKRDGDGVTRGQYHILLPDGRIQNVAYHVDDSGYHADVTYESVHHTN